MNYYITIASIRNNQQNVVMSTDGSLTADDKSDVYEEILSQHYLKSIFEDRHPDLLYDDIVVLFCKVW